MTARRIRYVAAPPLAEAVRRAGLDVFLRFAGVGPGEKAVSSLFEALVAGIYLDGGLSAARAFVRAKLPVAADCDPNLREICRSGCRRAACPLPHMRPSRARGEVHAPLFTVRAVGGGESAVGTGGSLRAAQKAAAKNLLEPPARGCPEEKNEL